MNKVEIKFLAMPENQAFARVVAAAFATQLNPTVAEINEIKTAVSEAVTNAIIHGYSSDCEKEVVMRAWVDAGVFFVEVVDSGCGIEDVNQAREPLYTSKPDDERSGMGFTVMEEFMDSLEVQTAINGGTTIKMSKKIGVMS